MNTSNHRGLIALSGVWLLVAVGCKSGMVSQPGDYSMSRRNDPTQVMPQRFDPVGIEGFAQAREMERRGQIDLALQRYEVVSRSNPDMPDVWHRMGVAYDKVCQPDRAQACYERAIALNPSDAELWCDFGYGQFLQGDFAKAESSFRRALDLNPNLSRAHNNLGLALAKMGNSDVAMQHFKMAGCEPKQAADNLRLACETPLQAQLDRPALAMRNPTPEPVQATAQSESLPGNYPTPTETSIAMHESQPNQITLEIPSEALPPNDAQASDMQVAALEPVSVPAQSKPLPINPAAHLDPSVFMEVFDEPIVLQDDAPETTSSQIQRLNEYATDPSVTKNPAPTSTALAPPQILTDSADVPKSFTKSVQKSFLESKRETEEGVFNLISDSANDEVAPESIPANVKSEVIRRIGDVD